MYQFSGHTDAEKHVLQMYNWQGLQSPEVHEPYVLMEL
jgi:hypothetical protein